MFPWRRSAIASMALSFVVGVALATTCGILGSPSFATEIPAALLWVPAGVAGVFIGFTFAPTRLGATIAASIPLVALGVLGFGGFLPYTKLPDPWAVVWGSYIFSLWAGVYLAHGVIGKRDAT